LAALLGERVSLSPAQCVRCINQQQTREYIAHETLQRYTESYTLPTEVVAPPAIEKISLAELPGRLTELFFYDGVPIHWLPLFPVTNPPRQSPWLFSQQIRQAAYYQLRQRGLIKGDWVIEMVRRGERMVKEAVPIQDIEITLSDSTAETIFIYGMQMLLQISSKEEMRFLPAFAEMFASINSRISPVHVILPPSAQYLILQYQSIIYSLIILLQSRFLSAGEIPEFSGLWDLTRFKVALSVSPSIREGAWARILSQMDSESKALWNVNDIPTKAHKKKAKEKKASAKDENSITVDKNNPFSVLSTEG
jgi:hypothetical protein